jgi:hypothetical protein
MGSGSSDTSAFIGTKRRQLARLAGAITEERQG